MSNPVRAMPLIRLQLPELSHQQVTISVRQTNIETKEVKF